MAAAAATAAYQRFLLEVARGQESQAPIQAPIQFPILFLLETLASLGSLGPKPTPGIKRMLDILFSHPDLASLLSDPEESHEIQQHFVQRYLPQTDPSFAAIWTGIILPTWTAAAAATATASKDRLPLH